MLISLKNIVKCLKADMIEVNNLHLDINSEANKKYEQSIKVNKKLKVNMKEVKEKCEHQKEVNKYRQLLIEKKISSLQIKKQI